MRILNKTWLVIIGAGVLGFSTATAQEFSRPIFNDPQDIGQLRNLMNESIGFSIQNQDSKFENMPDEVQARHFQLLNNATVSRWTLGWDQSEWSSYVESFESVRFGPPIGIDQQPINPGEATDTYGPRTTQGEIWQGLVADWETSNTNAGGMSCTAAISALYTRVCFDPKKCDIETEYQQSCVIRHDDKADAQSCVAAVSDYTNACYNGPGLEDFDTNTMLSGGGTSERPLCNVASFKYRGEIAFATADHCVPEEAFSSRFHNAFQGPGDFMRAEDGSFGVHGDFAFLQSDNAYEELYSGLFALEAARAREFAPTMFAGNNALALLANEVAEMNNLQERLGLYWIDRSPLCTVVDYNENNGEMLHTCQTTEGGSGGMLIQKHEDAFVIVGINIGPSEDDQNVTNVAQFASGSAFED